MNYEDLTPEQVERAKACKMVEDLHALVADEGMEFSDKELNAISAGSWHGINDDCNHHGCGGFDCFMFGCTTVDCTVLDCSVY